MEMKRLLTLAGINQYDTITEEEFTDIVCGILLGEKWAKDEKIEHTGEHAGKTVAELRKEIENLKGKKGNKEKMGELLFALRAKTGWKKGKGATK